MTNTDHDDTTSSDLPLTSEAESQAETGPTMTLEAPERLTIQTVSDCREAWDRVFADSPERVILDLRPISATDTAGWQLVESFRRACSARDIELEEYPCSAEILETWQQAIA